MLLSNLSIRSKLILTSFLPVLGIIILIITSLSELKQADDGVGRIYDDRVVPLEDLKIIADDYAVFVIDAVNKANAGIITGDEALKGIRSARAEIEQKWGKYMATALTAEEAQLANEAKGLFAAANKSLDEVETALSNLGSGNLTGMLNDYDGPLYTTIDPISEKIAELISLQLSVAGEERNTISEVYDTAIVVMASLGVAVAALLVVIGKLLYGSIRGPLDNLNQAVERVAESSDLTAQIEVKGSDELSMISGNFNKMLTRILATNVWRLNRLLAL
ncbi:MCP four helix bundle domain-containing protein [Neptuniibacter sp.]|uniref:MCP four helix bundle domain-containing protein n=1 Tax=Neptuniibacter sp. TaxID=1962643 RepID=UPI00260F048C|nr:MCP four helix bundle domain-containing protein [Neptuniibacter sp.]